MGAGEGGRHRGRWQGTWYEHGHDRFTPPAFLPPLTHLNHRLFATLKDPRTFEAEYLGESIAEAESNALRSK